ncbi:substrate-binding domain-containing protein [Geobacter sp. DSM 9736]|uniref:substrate-binding domain-containing protein n=1 Tax=Geobacter sp. DSM 9736 TaxID=1277350 RepID=UPI000B500749|nr:substrate-binding domain-containing protein [Geobacter sp. DSM 9736]SNB46525.1 phosphate ABC transporter substrate-binding protein, PhoT family [Geobacter sp. DSM 9736]
MKVGVLIALLISISAAGNAGAETIRIGGSGGMIPLVTDLAKAYMKKNPGDSVEVNQKSLGQPGGIIALMNGGVDIAMSATDLTPEQKALPVLPLEIARTAAIIAVNSSVPVRQLSSRQLCDIYTGKITNWKQLSGPDARILPLTRPESDSTKAALRRGIECFSDLKESGEVVSLPKTADMLAALLTKPNAIGFIEADAIVHSGGKVKALILDGKNAEASIRNWPLIQHLNLVLGKNRGEGVKRFLSFIKSPQGQAIIRKSKAVPADFNF